MVWAPRARRTAAGRRRRRTGPGPGRARSGRPGRRRGSRGPPPAPPSTRTWSTPRPPRSSSTSPEVARQLEGAGAPRPPRAPCPSTTRRGWSGAAAGSTSGRRTVSAGSSARTVPAPTSTASDRARSRWASARASSPGDPPAGAVGGGGAPVEGGGQLEHHPGPAGPPVLEVGGELLGHRVGAHADSTSTPARREGGDAPPGDLGVGVGDADHHPADPGGHDRRRCTAGSGRGGRRARGST